MSIPLAITGVGMVTGVGLSAPATCAAIRCAIDNFQETRFMDDGGEWIIGSSVELEQSWRGETKLIKMAAASIKECLDQNPKIKPEATPLLLCLSEPGRVGRVITDDNQFFVTLQEELKIEFHQKSRIIAMGHVSIGIALQRAREIIEKYDVTQVLIAASDSLLVASTLMDYQEKDRLLTSNNSNGFIPGEAGASIIVEASKKQATLKCFGIGFGVEEAHIDSEIPLRADGLTIAIKESLQDAQCEMGDLDFRISDVAGEQYHFKEATLALGRTLRKRKPTFDIWHPADCIGEVGSVIGLVMLIVFKTANEKNYSDGRAVVAHVGNDDGKRSACILKWS
ncbi:3-oxoacyl-ACP synthase [Cocleimonas flava]|uniref:3-oxoacyl-[acyl-carrier-protein] synthase-1 n=1 Tax=Cocleimonas flava TaxID=634765 RepID=A0A4R1F6E6_9GAMM|nr:hypothetical protein [Cocleimonas flava]TCJ87488.1 3-oxoacyl-[acyl-carrier-protein] synthase-1 [Cocleimonas flava]